MTCTLKNLFAVMDVDIESSTVEEIKEACDFIIQVQSLSKKDKEGLIMVYQEGPLFFEDMSKGKGRFSLLVDGFLTNVVVKGEEGLIACTLKGALAYNLLQAGNSEHVTVQRTLKH